MAINMDKMKARREALQSRGSGGSNKEMFWRPQDGESTIRIVPSEDGDPFKDYWFHYNVGNNPGFLSPKKNFGEEDPLDNFVRSLFKEGSEDSIKMAKSLMARQRFFAPVLVRGEEEKGVRVWGFGKMAYQELLNLVLNPDYGDITDVDDGTDLVITYGKPPGAQFPQTTITPRRKSSPLTKTKKQTKDYLEQVPDVTTLFEKKSPNQVQEMLDQFLLGEEDAEEVSTETKKYQNKSDTPTSVDQAFSEFGL
jgi:hypothetical protein